MLTWLALVATGPSGQLFDASVYVDSANRLVDGLEVPAGYGTRGALTQLVYVPAALASKTGLSIERAVLFQNALLLAALAAFLVPALLRRLGTVGTWSPAWSCLAVVVVLGRFAPVGFMDIWSLAAVVGMLVLVATPTRSRLVAAGALLGAAVNLRPAYLLPSLLLLLAWAVWVRRGWIWVVLGSTTAVLSQGVLQLFRPGSFETWWDGLQIINEVQLTYSAWVVRYDTVPSSIAPQQFFCDPDMAAVQQAPISSPSDLVGHLMTYVPQSIDLVAQKLTAWLMWTWSTPYYDTFDPSTSQLSLLVVAAVVAGGFGWVQAVRRGAVPRSLVVAVGALALGVLGGAVAATPEARFALPLVVLGLVGVALIDVRGVTVRQGAGLVLAVVVVVLLGQHGLDHPAPPGPVTPETCSTA
ncbi:hypothetical protein J2X46_001122 [Nocardioides sp. BE266]|uniref:hypothetical protein n=1 Tax=Nocardioides sp. BE266 TaxID=2817725 RepID=UPI00285AABB4|nr:hypothetical protein [Nocardioides sp. BE266]MDR7252146.1 hypothetical protein [Nocardioides sp. BE266]